MRQLLTNSGSDRLGDTYTTGIGQTLKPCCDIDAITIDIATIHNDFAKVQTDSEFNPTIFG